MVSPEVFRLSLRHLGHRTRKRLVHGPGPREQAAAPKLIGVLLLTIKIGQVAKEGQLFVERLSVIVVGHLATTTCAGIGLCCNGRQRSVISAVLGPEASLPYVECRVSWLDLQL